MPIAVLQFLLSHRAVWREAFSLSVPAFAASVPVSVLCISYLMRILPGTFLSCESHQRSRLLPGCVECSCDDSEGGRGLAVAIMSGSRSSPGGLGKH